MAVAPEKAPEKAAPERPSAARNAGSVAWDWARKGLALRESSIIVVIVVSLIYFGASVPGYFTGSNFKNLLPYFCFLAIMAAGQVFVMTLGEIDLSVGALYLITPFIFWKLTTAGIPLLPSVIIALVIAAALGGVNGFFTAYVGIPSFVATLAMLFFLDGLALILSHSEQITTPGTSVTGQLGTFANVFGGGTYSELIWALVIMGILQVALSFTRWGIYTVATGGNKLGAAEAGVKTRRIVLRNFMLCAATAGLAGILEGVRTSSITPDPSGSNQFLLYSIAAVIIGGTLMTGGEGTVVGAFLGALFLGILQDGLNLKSVPATYVYLWLGIAVIIAMVLYVLVRRIRMGSGHG